MSRCPLWPAAKPLGGGLGEAKPPPALVFRQVNFARGVNILKTHVSNLNFEFQVCLFVCLFILSSMRVFSEC